MKYQKILLQIIEEEIDRFIMEQAPATPPADPAAAPATPPADPSAAGGGEEEGGDEPAPEDKLGQKIKALAAKTPMDIKKTILSALQNGAEKEDTEALVAYVQKKEQEPDQPEEDTEATEEEPKEVPENIKKAVKHIVRNFKFKVPEKAEKKAEKEKEKEEGKDEEEETAEGGAAPAAGATPPAAPGAPAAPTPPATPVTESRLQTSLREYLMYKQLLQQKVRR